MKPTIAIAGATGFIGKWFIEKYHQEYNIIALSRREMEEPVHEGVVWKKADLFSITSTMKALEGADCALYLIHSMQASARLNQASFEDTDLLLADNFVRAAEHCRIGQIIYMGGILPKEEEGLSKHLKSRYEVEKTLGSRTPALTALRAGIVVGPEGSSFRIIEKLVSRLPVLVCPKWTQSRTQPIALYDVLKIISLCVGNEAAYNQTINVGEPSDLTYLDLLCITAEEMGKKRTIKTVDYFTPKLSKLWVSLFSGSEHALVSPLIDSLKHEMTAEEHPLMREMGIEYMSFREAAKDALDHQKNKVPELPKGRKSQATENTVRSVQRLPNPENLTASQIADSYLRWLPRKFKSLIRIGETKDVVSFRMLGVHLLKLQLVKNRSDDQRQLFFIVGGFLAKRTDYGWLEFRSVLNNTHMISAIHEFIPRLPWFIYVHSQAKIHLWVMNSFASYLKEKE